MKRKLKKKTKRKLKEKIKRKLKEKIKKTGITFLDNIDILPMTLIYGYFIIFLLLIIFLYTLYIVGAYAPQYLKEIYNLTNTILFIMVFISFIASVKFYQYAKNIRYWLGNVIKIITDQIPTWISRLLFLLLGVIAVLVLNQMLNQLTRGIVNKLIGNIVNDCSNYSALIAGLGGFNRMC